MAVFNPRLRGLQASSFLGCFDYTHCTPSIRYETGRTGAIERRKFEEASSAASRMSGDARWRERGDKNLRSVHQHSTYRYTFAQRGRELRLDLGLQMHDAMQEAAKTLTRRSIMKVPSMASQRHEVGSRCTTPPRSKNQSS